MSKTPTSVRCADIAYRERMKEKGFIWKSVFIPENKHQEFKVIIEKWKVEQLRKADK